MMRPRMLAARLFFACGVSLLVCSNVGRGQISKPADAPEPMSADASSRRFQVPDGFRVELVASEPLVREPSGFCWDERGQLFVCELHGYNLEGQYDIEELNQTGKLDRVVRRIQADERHKQAAAAETYGTIRRMIDADADGKFERSQAWADRLPPCLGICATRGGIIAACQTQILFLADRDGNGQAEIREVLFEGFKPGPLERSINCPQYGPDDWIYVGRGAGGGTIRGKYLAKPVELPSTDFRIKADGTAIEPIVGGTGTMGFAFTESGDRFTISTRTPGIFIAPFEWCYLARNPDVASAGLDVPATSDQRVYPASQPHPWRTQRAADPGFSKYYSDRYGIQESAPNGYFTSACSPLVYQDSALPGLRGQLLACEPAQNLIHRAIVTRDGSRLLLSRPESESHSEFLTSSDPWFHAIALAHAPDGSIYIADFYREIIEDYSAIPRYLQQLYGLVAGRDHGRVWKLTHENQQQSADADMSQLAVEQLAREVVSPHYWRRMTARRLLVEGKQTGAAPQLAALARESTEAFAAINALQTLDGLGKLAPDQVAVALEHADPSVRRQALRFAERWFDSEPELFKKSLAAAADPEAMVRLQLALSLGQSRQPVALETLADLAREHGHERWMTLAILTSVPGRGGELLARLFGDGKSLEQAESLLEPLCNMIANRRDGAELSQALMQIASLKSPELQTRCLRGVHAGFRTTANIELSDEAREQVRRLVQSPHEAIRTEAIVLVKLLRLESPAERQARLDIASKNNTDVQEPL
ncbi:MAG: PVC-type heme-binding CxxCH protein, partial [Aureliella sp.]